MSVVSFSSAKGGVGKTSICVNLAGALTTPAKTLPCKNSRVLLIDLDSQGSASHHLAKKFSQFSGTISQLLPKKINLQQAIHRYSEWLHFIPCDRGFADYTEFGQRTFTEELKDVLARVRPHYDFIFLDLPPTLSTFSLIPLFLSDYVLLPVSALAGELSIHGVTDQLYTVKRITQEDNPQLKILGLVITMEGRTRLCKEVVSYLKTNYLSLLFQTHIPQSARLAECSSIGATIFQHGKSSAAAKAFSKLAEEFLSQIKKKHPKEKK